MDNQPTAQPLVQTAITTSQKKSNFLFVVLLALLILLFLFGVFVAYSFGKLSIKPCPGVTF